MLKQLIIFVGLLGCVSVSESDHQYKEESSTTKDASGCVSVDVDELYLNYENYEKTNVCTFGKLEADVGGVRLLPSNPDLTLDRLKMIRLIIRYGDLLQLGIDGGDYVYVRGEFSYDKECFGEFETGVGERICAPQQFPMYLSDVNISKIDE